MKISVLATMLGACLLAMVACGSDDEGSGQFSCVSMTTDSISCVDYRGGAATTGARDSCTRSDSTVHEGELCPMDNVGGICSFAENGGTSRVFYYDLEPADVPVLEAGCTDGGGTWSTG